MLKYNFDRIFKARGIDRPFTFLRQAGFHDSLATSMKRNRVNRMNLPTIEKVCILLKCTPNDLMEWEPDDNFESFSDHPLNVIRQSRKKTTDLSRMLSSVPLEKLGDIEEIIKKEVGEI